MVTTTEAARLLEELGNSDRDFDAVVIGEPQRAFYGNQFDVRANPDVTVEVGTKRFPAKATIVEDGPYRDELYAKLVAIMDQFAEYGTKTDRHIPVIVLDRAD